MAFVKEGDIIILGVRVDDLSPKKIIAKCKKFLSNGEFNIIFTPNPEICLKAERDEAYRKDLNEADLNIPDGVGLKLGAEILGQKLKNRFTGVDLTQEVLRLIDEQRGRVFLIIKADGLSSLKLIIDTIKSKYQNVQVNGVAVTQPGKGDLNNIIAQINTFKPTVVITSLGAPYQERLLIQLKERGATAQLGLAVGGSFDFMTGAVKRAPKWWRDLGMEWFYRLLRQPQRIGRIKDATIKFPLICYKWKKRMASQYRPNVMAAITKDGKYLVQNAQQFSGEHWQLPQGGVDPGESPRKAVVREAAEELGAPENSFRVIKKLPVQHSYDWPRWAKLLKGYKGQRQNFYLLEFTGNDADIDLSKSHEVEAYRWVKKKELLKMVHPKRRKSLKKIMPYL